MKRCLTLLLALVLALSLAACGAKSAGPDTMTGDYNGYESAKKTTTLAQQMTKRKTRARGTAMGR